MLTAGTREAGGMFFELLLSPWSLTLFHSLSPLPPKVIQSNLWEFSMAVHWLKIVATQLGVGSIVVGVALRPSLLKKPFPSCSLSLSLFDQRLYAKKTESRIEKSILLPIKTSLQSRFSLSHGAANLNQRFSTLKFNVLNQLNSNLTTTNPQTQECHSFVTLNKRSLILRLCHLLVTKNSGE